MTSLTRRRHNDITHSLVPPSLFPGYDYPPMSTGQNGNGNKLISGRAYLYLGPKFCSMKTTSKLFSRCICIVQRLRRRSSTSSFVQRFKQDCKVTNTISLARWAVGGRGSNVAYRWTLAYERLRNSRLEH